MFRKNNRHPEKNAPNGFVFIPPGEFFMGSLPTEPGRYDDETRHRVSITKGFFMKETPVTQAEWEAVMGEKPANLPPEKVGPQNPVECVSWNDVQEFLEKYSAANGGTFRLPTEAEWEYACRAGTETAFHTGEITSVLGADPAMDAAGWYFENSEDNAQPVRQKAPNAFGLYDMHGNVHEWVQDWYGIYPAGDATDPAGPEKSAAKVVRGGGYQSRASECRSAHRTMGGTTLQEGTFGFRIAMSLP